MMNRIEKIKLLEKVFSESDTSILKDANKKDSIVLIADADNGLERREIATFGNQITLWNYSDIEIKLEKENLLNEYENVILIQLSHDKPSK